MTNPNGRFGIHGGQYIPETLMNAVIELEEAYNHYKNDPGFNRELRRQAFKAVFRCENDKRPRGCKNLPQT